MIYYVCVRDFPHFLHFFIYMEKLQFTQSDRIVNISGMETSEAIESAKLCETVRIRVRNLTPRGRVSIPVRIEKQRSQNSLVIDIIEEIARYGISTPEQFEKIEEIHNIMTDNIHIFTRAEIESMKKNFIQ